MTHQVVYHNLWQSKATGKYCEWRLMCSDISIMLEVKSNIHTVRNIHAVYL